MANRARKLYEVIATALAALNRCRSDDANESQQAWATRWEDLIAKAAEELPRGSGFDSYPVIETDDIKPERIVINGSYHNMDSDGCYAGWTDYRVIVRPSFIGAFKLSITGGNSDFKDYAYDEFKQALDADFEERA
jgi:hypothetical protein